jgi:hypothetical protein
VGQFQRLLQAFGMRLNKVVSFDVIVIEKAEQSIKQQAVGTQFEEQMQNHIN